jgi:threonine aldolase
MAKIAGLALDPAKVVTNIVVFDFAGTGLVFPELRDLLKAKGLLISAVGGTRARAVTNLNVSRKDCEAAVKTMEEVLAPVCAQKAT